MTCATARAALALAIVATPISGGCMGFLAGTAPPTLGAKNGRLAACPESPNCVSSQTERADTVHYIAPLPIGGTAEAAWATLKKVLLTADRARIVSDASSYLHAEFSSRLLGFVDDVEFLLDADAGVIHVRSASRLGRSDFGVNRQRIEDLRARFVATAT